MCKFLDNHKLSTTKTQLHYVGFTYLHTCYILNTVGKQRYLSGNLERWSVERSQLVAYNLHKIDCSENNVGAAFIS